MSDKVPLMQITIHKGMTPYCTVLVDPPQAGQLFLLLNQSVEEKERLARQLADFMMTQERRVFHRNEDIEAFPPISVTYYVNGVVTRMSEPIPYRVARTFMFAVSRCRQMNTQQPIEQLKSDIQKFLFGVTDDCYQSNPFFMKAGNEPVVTVV